MPFYDNFSIIQPTDWGGRIAQKIAVNQMAVILKHHPAAQNILELGPGRGPFAAQCRKHHFQYTCVDVSARLLAGLAEFPARVQALVPPLPFASDTFDVAFAANFLEHMLDFRHAFDLVGEMTRVVRSGGLVCHSVPNAMEWGLQFWNGDYTHSFPTTPRRVVQLYQDAGLTDLHLYPLSGPWIGSLAHLGNLLGKLVPVWLVGHGADTGSRLTKTLFSTKTTFLASFIIVGRKPLAG